MSTIDSQQQASPFSVGAMIERLRGLLRGQGDSGFIGRMAGTVFLTRVASAVLALVSQVFLARWMGAREYGIYIYVWTWVLMIGALSDMGLSSAARRFIPEYTELKAFDKLRGFVHGSGWLAFAIATGIGAVCALAVLALRPWLDDYLIVPLFLACAVIPIYGLVQVQSGIAQSYDWHDLALLPFYIWRPIAITAAIGAIWVGGFATDAVSAMVIAAVVTWGITAGQFFVLRNRVRAKVPDGPRAYEPRIWIATSLPIFMVEAFYLLLTYVDVLALEHYRTPDEVAIYYAAARILAIVAFVYFAIANSTAHKFSEYHVAGNRERLSEFFAKTIKWTFWPSLAACVGILLVGYPVLSLFGPGFTAAYPVMFILAAGMLARAAVGPAERLLNMMGERMPCAVVYAGAFAINLVLCMILIPRFGIEGAAAATSTALIVESICLYLIARWRLGFHVFIMGAPKRDA